jgi:Flp pilus assembly protein TadG
MKLSKSSSSRTLTRKCAGLFRPDDRGVAAIEFALIIPILALLLLGCFEVPQLVLLYQKIARTSSGVADLVAQADNPMTTNQMTDIFISAQNMMQPYDLLANGEVIVSSINNVNNTGVVITWQTRMGTDTTASKLGAATVSNPPLPSGIGPASNEEVIATEVYFNYTPIFKNYIYSGSRLYLNAYTRPRNHNLNTSPCPGQTPPASCTITVPPLLN